MDCWKHSWNITSMNERNNIDLWLKAPFFPAWWPLLKQGPAFCHLKHQKDMFGLQTWFSTIFEWKICWFVMSQPIKSIVNNSVFIRFHFFDFFMNLMISGPCLDLILDTFEVLGDHLTHFLVYWRLLEISLIFRVSPETPQAARTRLLGGKLIV